MRNRREQNSYATQRLVIMPKKLTKERQQEVVADFVYNKGLELCMYVYLDAFLDKHRANHPQDATAFGTSGIKALLEAPYEMIRERIRAQGLLTESAAGEYMMSRKK
ncbi:hypothetical protein EDD11_009646 [Mortierella claussenii]|nr:hypothetical protein EDD11_009646 [Mortierella claussenii]